MSISKPTIDQWIHTAELTIISYTFAFLGVLVTVSDPLNTGSLVAAHAAGIASAVAFLYRFVKSLTTDL